MTTPQIALTALEASWTGPAWPPEDESAGLGVSLEGSIVGNPRRVECRRGDVQKGYLSSKKTGDILAKYTEITIRLDSPKLAEELKKNCAQGKFLERVGGGETRFFTGSNVVRMWAPATVVGELASIMQVPDPLSEGDRVKIYNLGGTMMTKTLEITQLAKRTGKTMSIMGETHMYGVVQGGPVKVDEKGGLTDKIFAAKANMPSKPAKEPVGGGEVAEEEWDS